MNDFGIGGEPSPAPNGGARPSEDRQRPFFDEPFRQEPSPVGPGERLAAAAGSAAGGPGRLGRRLKLGHVVFVCLLLSGIIPLAVSSALLISTNRRLLVDQEREMLLRSAQGAASRVDRHLMAQREALEQRGEGLLVVDGPSRVRDRLRRSWVGPYLEGLAGPDVLRLRVLDSDGGGPWVGPVREVPPAATEALDAAFREALAGGRPIYRLVVDPATDQALAALAVPVAGGHDEPQLVFQSLSRLPLMEEVLGAGKIEEAGAGVAVVVTGPGDQVLWAHGANDELLAALEDSGLLDNLSASPLALTRSFTATIDGGERTVEATGASIGESSWGVVVLKTETAAGALVRRMITNAVLSSLLLVLLAALFAGAVARWVSRPVGRLTEISHEIADGGFGRRAELQGMPFELADLAANFNRMSGHVESYVEQLRQAAAANRELFIGSIRAFAAVIDAKDPYTRGHSERVANLSRILSRYLGLDDEHQQRVWLGGLLHDVGKIGIDDRILQKGGLLTAEEFEQMKLHTVIGAEIMERIGPLKEMIPAIRWHHENWNGRGYPDGLKGEEIPLLARIVAVADTFDAVTTTRPYQEPYTIKSAVETVTKLTGTRFDAKVVTAFLKAYEQGEVEAVRGRPQTPAPDLRLDAAGVS